MPLDPKAQQLLDDVKASGRPNAHLLPVAEARANFEALFESLGPGEEVAETREPGRFRSTASDPRALVPAGRRRPAPRRRVLPRRRLAARLGGRLRHRLPGARQRLGRGRRLGRATGWRRSTSSRPRSRTRTRPRAGSASTPPSRRRPGAGSPSPATAPAATSRRSSPCSRASGASPAIRFQLLVYPVTTCDLEHRLRHGVRGLLPLPRRAPVAPGQLPRLAGAWRTTGASRRSSRRHSRPAARARHHRRVRPAAPAGASSTRDDAARPPACRSSYREYPGMIHGFFGLDTVFDQSADAMRDAGDAIRLALGMTGVEFGFVAAPVGELPARRTQQLYEEILADCEATARSGTRPPGCSSTTSRTTSRCRARCSCWPTSPGASRTSRSAPASSSRPGTSRCGSRARSRR